MNNIPSATSSGLDIKTQIVPVVRRWLAGGINAQILRSSVRVRELKEYAGGLKSPVVAKLSINVDAVIKQGSQELSLHELMMNDINSRVEHSSDRRLQAAMFPAVVAVEELPDLPADRNHLMIQEAFDGFDSTHELLYRGGKSSRKSADAVRKGLHALKFLHKISPVSGRPLDKLPRTPDPFTCRISDRLQFLRSEVDWLESAFKSGCCINGRRLPPLRDLMKDIKSWYSGGLKEADLRLVHGDPHLANLVTRVHGRGLSIRWIDPNPLVGFSDPAYDWGKLLHFIEPVGAAKESAKMTRVRVAYAGSQPAISARTIGLSSSVEKARLELQRDVVKAALGALAKRSQPRALLNLSIASAHVGFAAIPVDFSTSAKAKATMREKMFGLAFTLDALARCYEELEVGNRQ